MKKIITILIVLASAQSMAFDLTEEQRHDIDLELIEQYPDTEWTLEDLGSNGGIQDPLAYELDWTEKCEAINYNTEYIAELCNSVLWSE